jgi:lipoprotein-anchoring transpeptidase ErfK/SrfK
MVRRTIQDPEGFMAYLISRRSLVGGLAALGGLQAVGARAEGEEPFPVNPSEANKVAYKYRRRDMDYKSSEPAGTIVVDPSHRFLYQILGDGRATRYGVAVGHDSKSWTGEAVIGKMVKWPTWTPTPEHLAARPDMIKYKDGMPGGPGNPMGARALYLYQGEVDTVYRIHGTLDPKLIGSKATSGCFGMLNVDIVYLYDRVQLGTRVVVLKSGGLFG